MLYANLILPIRDFSLISTPSPQAKHQHCAFTIELDLLTVRVNDVLKDAFCSTYFFEHADLQLGLGLDGRQHEIADVTGGLVQEVAHALYTEVLTDNVELDRVLVDHVCHSRTCQFWILK